MSDAQNAAAPTNIIAEVASGNSPQPKAEAANQSDYEQVLDDAEQGVEGLDGGEPQPDNAIDAAVKAGDLSKSQAKDLKRKLKIKVDGEEFEEEIDTNDDEMLKRHLQKSKAFDKRVKEFTGFKSQVDQLMEMLKSDPESVLEKLGLDVDDFAEKRLTKRVEELKKSPEQIEREKMERELKDLREEKKRIEKQKETFEMERLRNESATQIENEIHDALDTTKSVLPKKNPLVLERISKAMLLAMNNGYPDVTVHDVIPMVEKQWKEELNNMFSVLPEETIEQLVGKDALTRYRKSKYTAPSKKPVQTATANQVKDTGNKSKVEDKQENKKNFKDVFNFRD